ncbi:5'/3'-nucleotidase SurE [Chloroflexota bacterium]
MKILVTNDDGISTQGLQILVKKLKSVASVIVAAPDREQSAIGTAVTLRQPLRVQKMRPLVPGVKTYSVEGTPADSVILALGKLVKTKIDLVISGINLGPNLGDDVFISGTVGGALQGYLRGFPTVAISVNSRDSLHLDNAAKLAALLAKKIDAGALPTNIFLNVNLPNLPLAEIKGIKTTQLANGSHTSTAVEGDNSEWGYYWLVRQKIDKDKSEETDIWAIEQGNISITPLHTNLLNRPSPGIEDSLWSNLFRELQQE